MFYRAAAPCSSRDKDETMPITALYASLLLPLFVGLSLRVIFARRDARIGIGDGGNSDVLRRMRVQANFAEYVPIALILLALAESLGSSSKLLHALGVTLLIGRLCHAYGVSQLKETLAFRQIGMLATFAVLITAALACLLGSAQRGFGL